MQIFFCQFICTQKTDRAPSFSVHCWLKKTTKQPKTIIKKKWNRRPEKNFSKPTPNKNPPSYGVIYRAICFVLSQRECVFIFSGPDPYWFLWINTRLLFRSLTWHFFKLKENQKATKLTCQNPPGFVLLITGLLPCIF